MARVQGASDRLLHALFRRIKVLETRIRHWHRANLASQRLATIPRLLDLPKFLPRAVADGMPQNEEVPVPVPPADMGETEEGERLWLAKILESSISDP